ncbi:MAG: metalloregulator ArsR/SmtB family transcription factor [Gammaproteobacteria bacterium]|nr:metalloregulator ArsR/SmtB family transcription factor [Gammaproteobacteria bacterium]
MTFDADRFFAALAHPLRLRAVVLLHHEGALCVCELTHALEVSQPMISRHLALLREAGVVQDRRDGLWVHYRLHPQLPDWAAQVVARAGTGLAGQPPYRRDREALAAMPDRPPIRCCA